MRRILPFIVLSALLMAPSAPARADAAPPREPPGSNLVPAGQTMVQMVAEYVLIVIPQTSGVGGPVNIQAVFSMRNQGAAAETMDVRFPLEPIDGYGNGWGERVYIDDFHVSVDGQSIPTQEVWEPFTDGPSISWAVFRVTFGPGEDVRITVDYTTRLYGREWAMVDYILETGAGWYGPIGSAVVVLRLPYAVSDSNIFAYYPYDPWGRGAEPTPAFVGREIRWTWRDLEPTDQDNLALYFIWPDRWQEMLDLEAQTGRNPSDVPAAVALAEAYREAGSDGHGFMVSEPLYRLSRTAIEEALPYSPESLELQIELAVIDAWWCDANPACSLENLAAIRARVDGLLEESPADALLLEMRDRLEWAAEAASLATENAAFYASATSWPITATAAAAETSAASAAVRLPAASATPSPTQTLEGAPADVGATGGLDPVSGAAGLAVGIGATLAAGAVLRRRRKS